ncbi:hypothetical protein MTO96_041462, partial [Rhipicephalus appendiculatus]
MSRKRDMKPATHYVLFLYLLLLFVNLTLTIPPIPPGFDSETLPYLTPGARRLRSRGAVCSSDDQCRGGLCCLHIGLNNPTCQPRARIGHRCSHVPHHGVYYGFCPCTRQ